MTEIDAVLFDMGGVIVRLRPIDELLAGDAMTAEEFWPKWLASPAVRAFERGQLDRLAAIRSLQLEVGRFVSDLEVPDPFLFGVLRTGRALSFGSV